jgi:RecB family exonuclease
LSFPSGSPTFVGLSPSAIPANSSEGLSVWADDTCLVRALVSELEQMTGDALQKTVVVLPTQRLAIWVTAALAKKRTSFVPPTFFTLESFLRHSFKIFTEGTDKSPAPQLSDLEAELLLAGLIKQHGFRHLRMGHEHEIHQLFAELSDWGLTEQGFVELEKVASENVYLSDKSVDTLKERIAELKILHGIFLSELNRLSAYPKSQILAQECAALPSLIAGASPPWNALFLVGFTSLKSHVVPVLRALLAKEGTRVWVNTPPDLAGSRNPLQQIIKDLGSENEGVDTTQVNSGNVALEKQPNLGGVKDETASPIKVVEMPSVLAEVAYALRLAQHAVEREGFPPSRVGILVSDDDTYGPPLRALVPRLGLETNMAISTPLMGTPLGTWIAALLELLRGDQKISHLLAYLAHPYTLGSSSLSRATLYQDIAETGVPTGLGPLLASKALTKATKDYIQESLRPFEDFLLRSKAERQPFVTWMDLLGPALEWALARALTAEEKEQTTAEGRERENKQNSEIHPALSSAVLRSAREALGSVLDSLHAIGPDMAGKFSKNDFLTLISQRFLTPDCRDVGEPLRGIQILSIEEARYIPFEKLIILGAAEGQFPRALPKDHLLDNYFKTRIGLPGWQFLEAIEDTTYHLLKARIDGLTLLYPEKQGTSPVVRSRFIESALVLGEAEFAKESGEDQLYGLLRPWDAAPLSESREETSPGVSVQGLYKGDRETLLLTASASGLTALIRCPYRFLLEKLGVRALVLKEEDDPQNEGDWLHQVLEAFFTGQVGRQTVAEPLKISGFPNGVEDFRTYALERLNTLTSKLAPENLGDAPVKLHLRVFGWPAFVEHVIKVYGLTQQEKERSAADRGMRETAIGHTRPVTLRVGSHRVRLRGSIDAVDHVGPMHLITDYKRRGTPSRGEALRGLSPQLTFYALAYAQEFEDRPIAQGVIGYWSILNGQWTSITSGTGVQDFARDLSLISSRDKSSLEEAVTQLLGLWQWRLDTLLSPAGLFRPDPSECGHCPYSGVCRRDDPVYSETVVRGSELKVRLDLCNGGASGVPLTGGELPREEPDIHGP